MFSSASTSLAESLSVADWKTQNSLRLIDSFSWKRNLKGGVGIVAVAHSVVHLSELWQFLPL